MPVDSAPPRGTIRVLLVEDSEDDAALVVRHLERAGFAVDAHRVETPGLFENAIRNARWDVVISDYSIAQFSSLDALGLLKEHDVACPFLIVSSPIGEEAAVEAMRGGAGDFVLKNNLARLVPALDRVLTDAELRRQAREERAAREAIERQLQQSQKVEAIGRLAGGIAHDFNNLLTAILGFTGLALDKLREGDGVQFELEQVKEAAERAARFTRQLLAFSRQQVMSPRVIDPAETLAAMQPMLRQLLREDIDVSFERASGASVRIDRDQFEQIVMNLAVNARDAMPRGGAVRFSVRPLDLSPAEAARLQIAPGTYMALSVADTGHGMDEVTRARIFEPFFTTKPPGDGTGLGLPTVSGILKQNGGAIDCATEVAKGTTFTVYLPLAVEPGDRPPRVERATRAATASQATVLVVDDEDPVRALVCAVLAEAGYRIVEARSGADALSRLDVLEDDIDLLITDIVMPGVVGPDLARQLRRRFEQLRVLYLSAYATPDPLPPDFPDAQGGVLHKPFLPGQLLSRVRERLGAGG